MLGALLVLPVERGSAGDLVAVLAALARAGDVGALRGCEQKKREVVAMLLQHVSKLGVSDITPAQIVGAVVSAARCRTREASAIHRLTTTAKLMLMSELEAARPAGPPAARENAVSTSSAGASTSAQKCPFPHRVLPAATAASKKSGVSAVDADTKAQSSGGDGAAADATVLASASQQDLQQQQQQQQQHARQMSREDIGALARAVAYLNIIDLELLSTATSVLRERSSVSYSFKSKLHNAEGADREGHEWGGSRRGDEMKVWQQVVANVAWAAAVMRDVDTHVHAWIASSLVSPCLEKMSAEQVCTHRESNLKYCWTCVLVVVSILELHLIDVRFKMIYTAHLQTRQ